MLVGLPQSTIAPLQRALNAAARLVLGLRPRDHVTAALIDLHWLPVAARIEYKLCTLVYQSVTGNAPTYMYITDMLQPVSDLDRLTQLRSASKGDLVVPRTRLKLGERAFRVAAPRLWNELLSKQQPGSRLNRETLYIARVTTYKPDAQPTVLKQQRVKETTFC